MDRRSFIRLLAAGLVAPVIKPQIKYILPPIDGWHSRGRYYDIIVQDDLVGEVVFDIPWITYLMDKGAFHNLNLDIPRLEKEYCAMRAQSGIKIFGVTEG